MNAIETQTLSKEYITGWRNRFRLLALDSLSLHVKEGSIYGFLGPNGAGKSTTIKLLLGLIAPTQGTGSLLGVSIHDKKSRERVGFLPEEPSFCAYLTADEFLELCSKVLHMDRALRRKRIAETLELVGLTGKEKTRISEFSRGMLQRIGLAQALLNMPDLVLLDEPLNGLDPYGRKELKDLLWNLKERGKTVFFSSHILSDVQEMCDEVGILNRGRFIAGGALKELLPHKAIGLKVEKMEMEMLNRLEPLSTSITRSNNCWTIQLKDPNQATEACNLLSQNKKQTVEVTSCIEPLEEFFFRKIEEDNKARGIA
jgi:ABC-2 type transport system ATP-binding protein